MFKIILENEPLLTMRDFQRLDAERPVTRADCKHGVRPCPFVGCRYHLMTHVLQSGAVRFYSEDFESVPETCALDVADAGAHLSDEVGIFLHLSSEVVRQIKVIALQKVRRGLHLLGIE